MSTGLRLKDLVAITDRLLPTQDLGAPLLAAGEVGIEISTGKLKIGDGVTAWDALSYFSGAIATQLQESSGPTILTIGAIASGEFLKRDGTMVVGGTGGSGGPPVLTPSTTLTLDDSQHDNFNPGSANQIVLLNGTGSGSDVITGMTGGVDGRLVTFIGAPSVAVNFSADDASSAPENQFTGGSIGAVGTATIVLTFIYVGFYSKWMIFSNGV